MHYFGRLLILSFCLLLINCIQEEPEFLLPGELKTIADIQNYLQNAVDNNILVMALDSAVQEGTTYCILQMENEGIAYFKKDLVKGIEFKPEDWRVFFDFEDGSAQEALLISDSIYVDDSAVNLNPFGTNPLGALVTTEMPLKGRFGIRVLGKAPDGITIEKMLNRFDAFHEIPVLGLYPEYLNEVELLFMNQEGKLRATKTLFIQTPSSGGFSLLEIAQNELPPDDAGIYLVSDARAGVDQRGAIRWRYNGDVKFLFRKLANGNMLVSTQEGSIAYHSPAFMEVSMLGETIRRYEVPNYLHHEVIEMPNGNFLVASNSTVYTGNTNDGLPDEDYIVEIDRATGEIVKSWNLNPILDPQRPRADQIQNDDWLHLNSLYFDAEDNAIIFSARHQSLVAKIGYEEGDLKWILAHPAGWNEDLLPFVLEPVNADGSPVDLFNLDFLPYFQHSAMKLPNGNLFLFDNGNFRNYYEDPSVPQVSYSRAVEYKIDEANRTVELVWVFDYDQTLFAVATGDVDYFPDNGHRLIGFMNGGNGIPKMVELDANDQIIFELDFNVGSYYRCEKMDLYEGL